MVTGCVSGTASRMAHQSLITLPVLVPPENVKPFGVADVERDVNTVEHARIVTHVVRRRDQVARPDRTRWGSRLYSGPTG